MNVTFVENSNLEVINEDLITTATVINAALSLPLNCYIIWLILAGARDTLVAHFFALNLAFSEVFSISSSIWFLVFLHRKSLFFCFNVFMFSRALLYTARPLFQCLICAECYIGVVHPVLFLQLKRLLYKVACCCAAWTIVLLFCIYSFYTYQNTLYLYGFFIQNLLWFCIMLFCCLAVLRALKRPGPGIKANEKKSNAMKRKAFKSILLIITSVAISFFLHVVTIPLQCCLNPVEFSTTLTVALSLAIMAGFTQPLLYLHRSGKLICFNKL